MSQKVSIDGLADAISKELENYAKVTKEGLKQAVESTGNKVKEDIQSTAPVRTGKYAKSWAVKKEKNNSDGAVVVVHSKNRYQLTHLLEFGHAKRGGGRVAAKPHIAAAEERGIKTFEEELRKVIEDG